MSSDASKPAGGAKPATQSDKPDAEWQSERLSEGGDDSVHDRTTQVPSLPAQGFADRMMKSADPSSPPPGDEPPTKPQAKVNKSWSAQTRPDATSSFPPPTPRASVPRLSLYPGELGSTPLGLAEVSAQDIELVSPPQMTGKSDSLPPLPSLAASARQMQSCYEVGDFSGALTAAEVILEHDPEDVEANRYAQSCRDVLTQMFSARLAPLDRVVSVAISPEQIRWLSLDHKSGFLLSLVDGNCSIEELLDVSGMPRLDALRILLTLSQQKVITLS
jgi:hypothetical protein